MENNNNIAEIHCGKTISEARTYAGQGALRSQEHEKLDADAQAVCQYGV